MHRVEDVAAQGVASATRATGSTRQHLEREQRRRRRSAQGCGSAYAFELTVVFDEQAPVATAGPGDAPSVPARLGGGE